MVLQTDVYYIASTAYIDNDMSLICLSAANSAVVLIILSQEILSCHFCSDVHSGVEVIKKVSPLEVVGIHQQQSKPQ